MTLPESHQWHLLLYKYFCHHWWEKHPKEGTKLEVSSFWGDMRDEFVSKWIQMVIILSSDPFPPARLPLITRSFLSFSPPLREPQDHDYLPAKNWAKPNTRKRFVARKIRSSLTVQSKIAWAKASSGLNRLMLGIKDVFANNTVFKISIIKKLRQPKVVRRLDRMIKVNNSSTIFWISCK